MLRRLTLCVLLLAALVVSLSAVGTVTVTNTSPARGIVRYTLAWTSDASGDVNANTLPIVTGRLIKAELVPGSTTPTDLYDVQLQDANNVDLLSGAGGNQSNTSSEVVLFDPPLFHDTPGDLELVVSNAGNAKTGTVYVWVEIVQ